MDFTPLVQGKGMVGSRYARRAIASVAALLSFAAGETADAGAAPVPLERSAPWNVNFGDESCRVQGEFGEGRQWTAIQMYFFGPGDSFELRVFGKAFSSPARPDLNISTDFGPIANPVSSLAMAGSVGKIPMAIVGTRRLDDFDLTNEVFAYPAITPEQERSVTYLDVRVGPKTYRLSTGPMDKVMVKVRECLDEMIRSWGYDPTLIAQTTGAEPLTSPAKWLGSLDYPMAQLMKGGNGLVQFRLDISETGDVTDCHLQQPMNPAEFNELTCNLLKRRARFRPALDGNGKPMRVFYISRVKWVMQS